MGIVGHSKCCEVSYGIKPDYRGLPLGRFECEGKGSFSPSVGTRCDKYEGDHRSLTSFLGLACRILVSLADNLSKFPHLWLLAELRPEQSSKATS